MLIRRLYIVSVIFLQTVEFVRIYCSIDARASCRTVPNLSREQLELCYRVSDVTLTAIEGLELAISECQHQFRWNRWNCSSLSTKSRNPHTSNLFKRGFRESAFGHAITSAGVLHSVARACSQGRLLSCGCEPNSHRKRLTKSLRDSLSQERTKFLDTANGNHFIVDKTPESKYGLTTNEVNSKQKLKQKMTNRWKWAGCSHNIDFGIEFSEVFLDSREKAGDIQSQINLHNNKVGRLTVANNLVSRCKCHGLSGSCQLKTCWKSSPHFRYVGKILKQQFRKAVLVDLSNFGNGVIVMNDGKKRKSKAAFRRRPSSAQNYFQENVRLKRSRKSRLENSLFYFQKSPNFCEKDALSDIEGTHGRRCNSTSTGSDACSSMCCGRGYTLVKEITTKRCNCRFFWCCEVKCQSCKQIEWISICN